MTWRPLAQSIPHRAGKVITLAPNETQWMNDEYVVNRTERHPGPDDDGNVGLPMIHLSIRNNDRSTKHDWRDFQRIKNQLAGPEYEAVEIYPMESELIDTANQYHLWCFPFTLGVGFKQGRKVARQAQIEGMSPGAQQRDPEPVDLQFGGLSSYRDLKDWMNADPTLKMEES